MSADFVLLGMTFLRHVNISQRDGRLILEPGGGR
jgi:predicted aspartyl protease